jgi:hypothetical protein
LLSLSSKEIPAMSDYACFGATVDDVLRRLPGDLGGVSHAAVEAALSDAEARVEAALPEHYRRLLRRVEGEVIVAAATEGQLSAAIGLPAASSLVLYADLAGPYADRTAADAMDPSSYELNGDGDVVTFSPALTEGTRVVADYDTTLADGVRVLAELVVVLAAASLARRACYGQPEWLDAMVGDGDARLTAVAHGVLGLPELDALTLYEDWERRAAGLAIGSLERS